MPIPHANQPRRSSLTMHYALNPPNSNPNFLTPKHTTGSPPSRPNSVPNFPKPVFANPYPSAPSTPNVVSGTSIASKPSTPTVDTGTGSSSNSSKPDKPKRQRASSTPPSPTSNTAGASGQIQCSGVTKTGKRCTRLVKNGPALTGVMGSNTIGGQTIERFCFQHMKELLLPTGFYARSQTAGTQEWVDFTDYIPNYLHPDTQVALRVEMEKQRSSSDIEGYIYTFEIRYPNPQNTIKLKVGRTNNVVKRLNQWGKQCGSKEQVLRGWYPGTVDPDSDDDDTAGQSLMRGRVRAGGKGIWCHRLERLVHLELADLAVNEAYLKPGWKPFAKGKGKGKFQGTGQTQATNPTSPSMVGSPRKGAGKNGKNAAGVFTNGLGNGGGLCKDYKVGQYTRKYLNSPGLKKARIGVKNGRCL
ncbi:hypothetical protein E1B28_002497 [Marasmius oreades]|uniref:Uncharacterized protein n=1 Tax=Marasmius oreades TaxID=181124 RepID=A0A9P7RP75_9AGAR|nr:uncharacterized protein E1B28_002497 [Marasmius oreades]KAG7086548.1 hypothetical protein E1B28_002497 [Marasmius oreades]